MSEFLVIRTKVAALNVPFVYVNFPKSQEKNIYLAEYFEITNPCGPCLQVTQSKINYDFLTAHARALSSVLRPDNWSGQLRRNGARSSLLFSSGATSDLTSRFSPWKTAHIGFSKIFPCQIAHLSNLDNLFSLSWV